MIGTTSSKPIRILLADDHKIFRDALRDLLELEPDIEVVLDVADGQSAIEKTLELAPDIVFLDIRMRNLDGINTTVQIKKARPDIHVICISMHHEKKFREAAFGAGASGYLTKSEAATELINAVRTVMSGNKYDLH
jgi:DNA-binding NarL/FixJ family response regulator